MVRTASALPAHPQRTRHHPPLRAFAISLTRRLQGLDAYLRKARQLSAHWHVPLPLTMSRLALARLRFNRGFDEFDLLQFTTRPVNEWRRYTTASQMLAWQLPHAPESARALDEDKVRFAAHCAAHDLPTTPLIGLISRAQPERDAAGETPIIDSADALDALFRSLGDFRGFAKPRGGGRGYGAFSFELRQGQLVPRDGARSLEEMFSTCATGRFAEQGYVLQALVQPHPALRQFMPGTALGTVRVCTFLMPDGELCVPYAVLKIPSPGSDSDNAHWGSLLVHVDPQSGVLRHAVGRLTPTGVTQEVTEHPVTGAQFEGATVPEWSAVRALVARAARAFSSLPALGWDIAVTPNGPLIIETNWQFGGRMPEVSSQRGWDDDYRELFARLGRPSATAASPATSTAMSALTSAATSAAADGV